MGFGVLLIKRITGIKRLEIDLSDMEVNIAQCEHFLPAPGQGILGIQTREDDKAINEIISKLDDPDARIQTRLERGLLARFDGGCQLPLGAYSLINGEEMTLHSTLGCRKGDKWTGLAKSSVGGKNVDTIVEEAYKKLTAQCESFNK